MAIQYINTGSSANAGNGDSLRSAFVKVNNNFAYLSTSSGGAGNGYTGSQGDIGYTGSAGSQGNIGYTGSAGISNVNIEISPESEVNSLAFYQTTSTISRVPRIKADGGVLFIGDKNSPGFLSGLYIENSLSAEGFGRGFTYANHLEVAESNNFTFYRSRGTPLVPTATVSGDEIVDINFLGHNGTTATYGFNITAAIDQVPVGGQQPMRLTFAGNNNAGQVLPHLVITSTSTIRMNKLGAIGNNTSISILSSLIPSVNAGYDLGSTSSQWRSLYVSSSTIYIDRKALSIDENNNITINGEIAAGGYTGSQGDRGYTGSRGNAGIAGESGATGFTGSRGNLGYTGSRGDTGYDGSRGDIGYTGSRGDLGYTGSRGDTGYDGSRGDIGYTGSEGTPGQQGNRGYTGSEGAQGTPGLQGNTGAQGVSIVLVGSTDTVTTSTVGLGTAGQGWINTTDGDVYFWNTLTTNWENIGPIVGPQGDLGYTGSQGTQGDIGLTGDLGYTGSQGDKGYDGSRGDVGYAGSQGELGYVGSQGDLGYVGSQGDIGYTGSQGELGYVGSQGDIGYVGSAGARGFQGYTGSVGFVGSQGDLGYTGSKGDQGTAGIDTTSTLYSGTLTVSMNVSGDLIPSTDIQQDLGSLTKRFRHVYVGPGSVYIGNNVITESATGNLVLPGITRATGYYAEEVEDDDDWGSNPTITSTVTVIDASRYRIISGQVQASANYNPATYTAQKDGNRVDEITVDETGGGWTKVEADYARDNNMYATNVADAINNFNAGDWQQIPFRVEIKAEDTEYEDIFGGGADLGELVIDNSNISSDASQNFVNLDVNNEEYMRLGTFGNEKIQLVVNYSGGVAVKVWEFGTDGNLKLPSGGDIVNSSGQSVLGGSGSADLGDLKIDGNTLGTQGADSNSWGSYPLYLDPGGESNAGILIPGVSGQSNSDPIAIYNTDTDTSRIQLLGRGGVEIRTNTGDDELIFEFDDRGVLRLPEGGDILNSSGQSVLGGGSNSYTPDDTDNWDTVPSTITAALDELAARVTALQNFEIDGGNAYTPALGEQLIDGNGA